MRARRARVYVCLDPWREACNVGENEAEEPYKHGYGARENDRSVFHFVADT